MNKVIILLSTIVFFNTLIQAQAPAKIKFQAVARDASNQPITDAVEVRLSVLQGSDVGAAIYVDEQVITPNSRGLFASTLGDGPVSGALSNILWGSDDYFLKAEIRESIGSGYQPLGTVQQILSVPYALYGKDEDANPNNEIQTLSLSGNTLSLSNGGGSVSVDANPNNEIQSLTLSGNTLSLSNGGGSVNLPAPPSTSILTVSARSMTFSPTSTIITPSSGGLNWANSFSNSAVVFVKKPTNYTGGDVTFKLFFRTTSSSAGTVEFFIRPRSFDSGDGFFDAASVTGSGVAVSGSLGFGTQYEQTLTIPADRLNNDWWYISIQRNSGDNTYTDDVIVYGVALEYASN